MKISICHLTLRLSSPGHSPSVPQPLWPASNEKQGCHDRVRPRVTRRLQIKADVLECLCWQGLAGRAGFLVLSVSQWSMCLSDCRKQEPYGWLYPHVASEATQPLCVHQCRWTYHATPRSSSFSGFMNEPRYDNVHPCCQSHRLR